MNTHNLDSQPFPDFDDFQQEAVPLTEATKNYFRACRSLVVSNEDCEFKDTNNHSPELVLAVIQSYESVFIKPMLHRAN